MTDAAPLLRVRDLSVAFGPPGGLHDLNVLDGLSFDVRSGEVLAMVGESGCGKSVTALSLVGLLDPAAGRATAGSAVFEGRDLLALPKDALRRLRGDRIAMIFQEPMTSLNPVKRVGAQIAEVLRLHSGLSGRAAADEAIAVLGLAGVPDPEFRARQYPHELSGGLRQRVMIGMAIACSPALLIADEATTALDVTVQAQILTLLLELRDRTGMSILLITHDLGVVAEAADRVVVLYAGRVAEEASAGAFFATPAHPYSRALLEAMPRIDRTPDDTPLPEIAGRVPRPDAMPPGCRFAPRCPIAIERCRSAVPPLEATGPDRRVACWRADPSTDRFEAVPP